MSSFERALSENVIEWAVDACIDATRAIDALDAIDGDPDLEEDEI
jgi:hypothetical protein